MLIQFSLKLYPLELNLQISLAKCSHYFLGPDMVVIRLVLNGVVAGFLGLQHRLFCHHLVVLIFTDSRGTNPCVHHLRSSSATIAEQVQFTHGFTLRFGGSCGGFFGSLFSNGFLDSNTELSKLCFGNDGLTVSVNCLELSVTLCGYGRNFLLQYVYVKPVGLRIRNQILTLFNLGIKFVVNLLNLGLIHVWIRRRLSGYLFLLSPQYVYLLLPKVGDDAKLLRL